MELPSFPGDQIEPARSGGDLCIQACANDPQVAVHAVRNLVRLGAGVVSVRWSQLGFGRTSSTSTGQATPRNLFGFKDGTNNLKAENDAALDRFVWVGDGDSGADWLAGGSYLVARRIRMLIEPWDTSTLDEQEKTIGRTKGVGAPLGQRAGVRPGRLRDAGRRRPAVPPTSHVFLANPTNAKTAILRRGYSFVDGSDGLGRLDAGLFFIAYQRDPRDRLRPGPAQPAHRRDERVHPAHVLGRLRLPARPARRRRLVGPDAVRGLTPRAAPA